MKSIWIAAILLLGTWSGFTRIHQLNAALQRGYAAYTRQRYPEAATAYKEASLLLRAPDEAAWLNMAHATVRAGRPREARAYYSRLTTSKAGTIRSVAFQQLAYLAALKADYAQALGLSRQALLANPANADARYNYELLRELLNQQSTQPQLPPPGSDGGPDDSQAPGKAPQPVAGKDSPGQRRDDQQSDQRNAPQSRPDAGGRPDASQPSAQPGSSANPGLRPGAGQQRPMAQGSQPGNSRGLSNEETGPEAPSASSSRAGTEAASNAEANLQTQRARLQQMSLSPGQARQLLEALHTSEQQYLQQLPRKATRPATANKPGW